MIEPSEHRPTQAIIDLNAIKHNIQLLKDRLSSEQQVYATVKANAYGHGGVAVSQAALEAGANGLAVATVDEGIELRKNGLSRVPILVLGLTDPYGIAEILHYNLTITVSDAVFFDKAYQQLKLMGQTKLLDLYPLTFHLALDTGMGRIGLRTREEVKEFIQAIQVYDWLDWEGVFTHFSTAGGGDEGYIETQWASWTELLKVVPNDVKLKHFSNSAMALWHNDERSPKSDIVRFGISMYGIDPKDEIPIRYQSCLSQATTLKENITDDLKVAMQLISEIIYVKQLPVHSKVSYGASYETKEDEWIATIPIGYGDGWLRAYCNSVILVDGNACPIVGVINMDQLMIKLPKYYPVGTVVTLIGEDGELFNHPSVIAEKAKTIGYEIVTNIGPRVPRVYLSE